jgi:hypothetical protein
MFVGDVDTPAFLNAFMTSVRSTEVAKAAAFEFKSL